MREIEPNPPEMHQIEGRHIPNPTICVENQQPMQEQRKALVEDGLVGSTRGADPVAEEPRDHRGTALPVSPARGRRFQTQSTGSRCLHVVSKRGSWKANHLRNGKCFRLLSQPKGLVLGCGRGLHRLKSLRTWEVYHYLDSFFFCCYQTTTTTTTTSTNISTNIATTSSTSTSTTTCR